MEYISYKQFKPQSSNVLPIGKSKKKITYYEDYICLDTETSHNHNLDNLVAWVYQWAFTYQNTIVYGRTPTQLMQSLRKIIEVNNADAEHQIMVFVHNLPYDFAYLQQYLIDEFGTDYKILAVANHKVFSVVFNSGLTLRCTYKLSNKSLDKWAKDLGTKHCKLTGAIDYNTIRYQDTPLYKNDWKYMFYDVIVLNECITKQMQDYNDNLLSLPLTSTSYVRREIKREYVKDNNNFKEFQKAQLTSDTYMMYRNEFSGGITHGNRFLTAQTIEGIIKHRDFVSHYPSCMRQKNNLYPVGKTFLYYDKASTSKTLSLVDIFALTDRYCVQLEIVINNMYLRDSKITMPYAQSFKFKQRIEQGTKFIEDNGRILQMQGTSIVCINEIDLKWINKQYKFNYVITKVYLCKKGVLPSYILDVIDKHFKGKSDYKAIVKTLTENNADINTIRDANTNLMKSKNVVNGIYGCTATSYGDREEFIMDTDCNWSKKLVTQETIDDALEKYYKSRNNCFRYEVGCYVTSYGRDMLMHFIELIGYENFIYCDTDSIFYKSTPQIEKRIENENKRLLELSKQQGAYITTDEGTNIYYNQFELEKEEITKFRFLHAKCYAYIDNSKLKVIIAGVTAYNKVNGITREQELGNINNLDNGFKFVHTGGTRCIYTETDKQTITINGHITETGRGAVIEKVDKTLNDNFDKILMFTQDFSNCDIPC